MVDTQAGGTPPATRRVTGKFSVTVTPQAVEDGVGDPTIGRMALCKTFEGDLAGIARGQMLAIRTDTPGSAGYVALDRFEGRLDGRSGGFSLQHSGSMERGAPTLSIHVIPDSGTGELTGIAGTFKIIIDGDKHKYEFEYSLPAAK